MRHLVAAFGIVVALSAPALSQCSLLAVTGTVTPGETVNIAVGGATPNANTYVLIGGPGSTTINLGPLGSLTVAVSHPFTIMPIGTTNASGALAFSMTIPAQPAINHAAVNTLQAVTVAMTLNPVTLSFCTSNTTTLSSGASDDLRALRRWTTVMNDANALDHTPSSQGAPHTQGQNVGPCRTARAMAMVQVAIFESLLAIDGGYQSYVGLAHVTGHPSRPAAIAQAAHDTLAALYPSQAAIFDAALETDLSALHGASKTAGIALGHSAAAAILALRANDGSNHAEPLVNSQFVCSDQPGFWRQDLIVAHPLALGAYWGTLVAPFSMTSGSQFRAPAPPALTSAAYAAAYNEVKAIGGDGTITSTIRTPDQTLTGIFWGYDGMPGLGTPQRLYNQILLEIADQQGSNAFETSRLLALANLAMADVGIAVWESKYYYQFWRPCSGIRQADAGTGPTGLGDNNPGTTGDTGWTPLGAPVTRTPGVNYLTPPFPAYPSGHAGFGASIFQTLTRFYGTDAIAFSFISDELNGVTTDTTGTPNAIAPRAFQTLSQAKEENGQSRIYLGIHWVFDKTAGIGQGDSVADWTFDHVYTPTP